MGMLDKILEKLGLKKGASSAPAASAAKSPAMGTGMGAHGGASIERGKDDMAAHSSMSEVDVVKHLESISKDAGLDWKVSIVDLLKLLKLDSSHAARTELAKELGCPDDLMKDSAKMNTWLHKEVLKKIAENGGNIPASMMN